MSQVASSQIPESSVEAYFDEIGRRAQSAAKSIAVASTDQKNKALDSIASQILKNAEAILEANAKDMRDGHHNQLTPALLDRLELNQDRLNAMAEGCRQIAALDDPVGEMTAFDNRPSGIRIAKMRVPLGVIGIIYESRPNVTIDAAALCLKSGNAVILRGGSEAIHSNLAIAECISAGLADSGINADAIQVVETTDRSVVGAMITSTEYVDIIIPRGGKRLIGRISAEATVPVIKHLEGLCHVYIDTDADQNKAIAVAFNAKARRYGICGAMETLLIAEPVAADILPELCRAYLEKGIELRGCGRTMAIVGDVVAATDEDWATEYLDAVLSIKVVDDISDAIAHISEYGSQHTDAIVSENTDSQNRFIREVDSSSVMVNASTQFADGFEYGLGAEIGISTDKLHVRGPVGLEGLTSQKYVVVGNGTTRN
ncbi:MAG: glutamate-5-semialdehyde dehydrogenase [Pseudomonadota bacterium]